MPDRPNDSAEGDGSSEAGGRALSAGVDLPGSDPQHDLDPTIEPGPQPGETDDETDPDGEGASTSTDPALGNTLISPENS